MNKRIIIKIGTFLATTAFASILLTTHIANARDLENRYPACSEQVLTYNPTLEAFPTDEELENMNPIHRAIFNIQHELSKRICPSPNTHHGEFPSAHKEEIDLSLSEHPPAFPGYHTPITFHEHTYYNDTGEDLNERVKNSETENPDSSKDPNDIVTANVYYRQIIKAFEFQLEGDFDDNILLNSINCSDESEETNNCDFVGNVNLGGENHKTNVSFTRNTNKILFEFPGHAENSIRPILYASNPTLDPIYGDGFDSTIDAERSLFLSLNFVTRDINADVWSATTTSRILLKDQKVIMRDENSRLDGAQHNEPENWIDMPGKEEFESTS